MKVRVSLMIEVWKNVGFSITEEIKDEPEIKVSRT